MSELPEKVWSARFLRFLKILQPKNQVPLTTHLLGFWQNRYFDSQITSSTLFFIVCIHYGFIPLWFMKWYSTVINTWSNWALAGLRCSAPLVVRHETRQLFLSSSESSESGQRLPKINRLSVQPQGWVRVTLHGAHSLGLSLHSSKHSPSLLHRPRTQHLTWIQTRG